MCRVPAQGALSARGILWSVMAPRHFVLMLCCCVLCCVARCVAFSYEQSTSCGYLKTAPFYKERKGWVAYTRD